jgi:hypothetical protein
MFGLFNKKSARQVEVDELMEHLKVSTQQSWVTYHRLYQSLNHVDRVTLADKLDAAVSVVEKEVSFEQMKLDAISCVGRLNKLQIFFTSVSPTDRLFALAGQIFITYLYAQYFWEDKERREISLIMREVSAAKP